MNTQWECMHCHWVGSSDEICKKISYFETDLDPEEWIWFCPGCDMADHFQEKTEVLCRTCEDEPVQHEGDQCPECYAEECERYVDASRGH